jgi:hypothetical protein
VLDESLKQQFKQLIVFYGRVKELVIASERYDPDAELSITAFGELRNALDHVMKAESADYGFTPADELNKHSLNEYYNIHVGKARAHLYRAAYDAYDVISIQVLDDVNQKN